MLVADTNAIACLGLPGPIRPMAETAYLRDADWLTVPLWRPELLNPLWKIQRTGHLSLAAAEEIFRQAERRMGASEHAPVDLDVWRLASDSDITAPAASFVVTARELGYPLRTQDRELLAKFPGLAISLADFAAGRN